jgi:hypothetical protein
MTPREHLWESVKHTLFCSEEEYYASLEGCTISSVMRGGKLVAILVYKGSEFHFVTIDNYIISHRDIIEVLSATIDKYGYVDTRTPRTDKRQQRFNERFGFVRTGEDEHDIHYRYTPTDLSVFSCKQKLVS